MEWNSTSLTQTNQGSFVGNGIPPHHPQSVQLQQLRAGQKLFGDVKDVCDLGINPPKNASPMGLPSDYGEEQVENENHQDLLVFGYGCKIFRDDERAQWLDDHKHMIPWMGNGELLIDRYDCRGALMDVARYEPGSGYDNSLDADDSQALNTSYEQEQLLEKELDEERYKDLNEDVDYDERAYDKGDNRRLSLGENGVPVGVNQDNRNYAAFQYNYNEQNHDICIGPEPKKVVEEDAPYEKPPGLYIPEEIILPSSMKIHAIIVKTAKFIASQGNQMEIILKTKQASNPLFDFLNHGGNLNQYYKFLVHAIRSGIFRPPTTSEDDMGANEGANQSFSSEYSGSEEDSEHTYLHPSLFRTSNAAPVPSSLSSVDFSVASAASNKNNAYSILVSKIKGTDSPDPASQQHLAHSSEYPPQVPHPNQSGFSGFNYPMSSQPAPKPQKKLPSTQDQVIIEKMASYVTKNGANFEEEVLRKNKSDPRFGFLNPSHEYHWYYLNCKERFKAECNAVVASSDFVHYSGVPSSSSSSSVHTKVQNSSLAKSVAPPTSTSILSIKKSVIAAELAELKRKTSGLPVRKETLKEKNTTSAASLAENVFSQANLVHSKDKEKSVIRFSTSLSFNSITSPKSGEEPSEAVKSPPQKQTDMVVIEKIIKSPEPAAVKEEKNEDKPKVEAGNVTCPVPTVSAPNIESEEEGEIRDDGSDSDLFLLDDGGGNSTPASEDDEARERRRLERKRKAVLFLQKLKMSKMDSSTKPQQSTLSLKNSGTQSSVSRVSVKKPSAAGTSLGDLLNQRMKTSETEVPASHERILGSVPPEITISDSDDNVRYVGQRNGSGNNGSRSSSNSRRSTRSKSRDRNASSSRTSRKRRKRRRSRSYSSSRSPSRSDSSSSYDSSSRSSYIKRKSSKKKRKKKKKKYEKSSRSSHKSKRR